MSSLSSLTLNQGRCRQKPTQPFSTATTPFNSTARGGYFSDKRQYSRNNNTTMIPCHHHHHHRNIPSTNTGKTNIRLFRSTTPNNYQGNPSYFEDGLEQTMKKCAHNFQENEQILASIYHNSNKRVRVVTIVHLVKACIQMRSKEGAEAAERLVFDWVMKFYKSGRFNMKNDNLFGLAIQAWVTSGHASSGKRAEILLDKLEEMERDGVLPWSVDAAKYATVMKAYSIHGDYQNTEAVFDRCKNAFESGNQDARPDAFTWSILMDAHIKSTNPDAWKIIEKMWDTMQSQYRDGILQEPPNLHICSTLLNAYSKSDNPEAWNKAEKFFDDMKRAYKEGTPLVEPPNAICYNAIINVFAKSNQPQKAEYWLEEMYNDYQSGNKSAQPDVYSFNSVIDAWARSGGEGTAKRCEKMLNRMIKVAEEKNLPIKPNAVSYNTVMIAYARDGQAKEAERVLHLQYEDYKLGNKLARPGVYSFNAVLDAWARSGEKGAAKRCEKILNDMIRVSKEKNLPVKPDTVSYNTVIIAYAREGEPREAEKTLQLLYEDYQMGNKSAQPDVYSFNSVIDAWARSGEKGAAERCEKILNDMIRVAKEKSLPVKPDTVSYNTVIIAYAREGQPREAERVLHLQHEDFEAGNKKAALDPYGFSAIIHGWAQAREEISGERAEVVLDRMLELHKDGVLRERPDGFNYNNVINAWAVLGKPNEAKQIFDRMMDDYRNKGNKRAKPDSATFNSLMQAYCSAKLPNAGELADQLLEQMKEMELIPSRGVLIQVVRCWRCSLGHGDPKARGRIEELEEMINELRVR